MSCDVEARASKAVKIRILILGISLSGRLGDEFPLLIDWNNTNIYPEVKSKPRLKS
tara:strand:+ start:921 stop:1088 length:168 start_codon:yes stop_codon:yes gene_type:complete